jgi:hypothetical protein
LCLVGHLSCPAFPSSKSSISPWRRLGAPFANRLRTATSNRSSLSISPRAPLHQSLGLLATTFEHLFVCGRRVGEPARLGDEEDAAAFAPGHQLAGAARAVDLGQRQRQQPGRIGAADEDDVDARSCMPGVAER